MVSELNSNSWGKVFEADRTYNPQFYLEKMDEDGLQVRVAIIEKEPKRLTRTIILSKDQIQIAVVERTETIQENDDLVNLCENIRVFFNGKMLLSCPCWKAEYNPLYVPEQLRQEKQFFGLISLHFKGIRVEPQTM